MKKILIHDPYLDTLGGGERYCLTVAEYFLNQGWKVDILWDQKEVIDRSAQRFGLKISQVNLLGKKAPDYSFFEKVKLTRNYDLVFWLSDGSVPFLFAKKNLIHFQVPFVGVNKWKFINKIKFALVKKVVCNSKFTKKIIDKEFRIKSSVLYPPIDIDQFKPGKKENFILAVGRFEQSMQAKRQDVLIKAFKQMVDEGLKNWQLVLIGGSLSEPSKNEFLVQLKRLAKGYPIKILVNLPFFRLKNFYNKSKIFWHAAGFEINERVEPWRVEHFGITPVEAMAAGCVPIVMDKGGLKEIVRRGAGERWQTVSELIEKTLALIKNKKLYDQHSQASVSRSRRFSKTKFFLHLQKII